MRSKIILTVVLLLFIASSVVALVVRTVRDAAEARRAAPSASPATGASPAGPRVIVYCFHGKVRCPTCETIEAFGREAVQEGFAEELRSGRLAWQVLDYEDPQKLPLAKQYDVIAPTIVVVRIEGGKEVHWENLSEVWGFVGDKAKFVELVRSHVRAFLAESGPAK
jgi:hypothetical protein